ncbi:MAG TPA: hypothetical protein VFI92_15210 [Steroidobacteraceae bacterium]|nr:hypothetical protein [Steroidobacteraceae bacterium]
MSSQDRDSPRPSDRDAALERAWRESSAERPPSHLDAALIAAARKSVASHDHESRVGQGRRQSSPWLARWQPLLAAAAVAGLALVLVPMLPRDQETAPALQREESTAAPAVESSPRSSPTPEDAVTAPPAPPATDTLTERRQRAVAVPGRSTTESEVPAPAAAPAPVSPTPSSEGQARERDSTADAAAAFGQAATSSQDPATWAARIEALHDVGEIDAAARELRAFRAVDPRADAYLPESLRDWARTVEPFPPDPGR